MPCFLFLLPLLSLLFCLPPPPPSLLPIPPLPLPPLRLYIAHAFTLSALPPLLSCLLPVKSF